MMYDYSNKFYLSILEYSGSRDRNEVPDHMIILTEHTIISQVNKDRKEGHACAYYTHM